MSSACTILYAFLNLTFPPVHKGEKLNDNKSFKINMLMAILEYIEC